MEAVTWKRTGGYLSDSHNCFTADGRFVLCPCGSVILVVCATTGVRVGTIGGRSFHNENIITTVERFDVDDCSEQYFASLDVANGVCVWEFRTDAASGSVSGLLCSRFTLDDLSFVEKESCEDLGRLERISLEAILSCSGRTRSLASASLVLVVNCRWIPLSTDSQVSSAPKHHQGAAVLSEDSQSDADDEPTTEEFQKPSFIDVLEVQLSQILYCQESQAPSRVTPLEAYVLFSFRCCSLPRKVVSSRRSVLRAACCGSFVAIVKNHSLCVWDRTAGAIILIMHNNVFSSVAFHDLGKYLVTGDVAGNVVWWHILSSRGAVGSLPNDGSTSLPGSSAPLSNGAPAKALQTRCTGHKILSNESRRVAVRSFSEPAISTAGSPPLQPSDAMPAVCEALQIPIAMQHWHSHPVRALAFTSNGLHVISAGEEAVLVFWHISQSSRHFMPRFGAPIHTVVSAPAPSAMAAVTLADNSLRIIDTSTSTVKAAFFGLQVPLSLLQGGTLMPIALRARRNDIFPMTLQLFSPQHPSLALVVSSGVTHEGVGANSRLQVYDLASGTSFGQMSVNKQNYVSRTDARIKKFQWSVQNVAMAASGRQLATVEFRRSMFPAERNCLGSAATVVHGSLGSTRGGCVVPLDGVRGDQVETEKPDVRGSAANGCTQQAAEAWDAHGHYAGNEHKSGRNYVLKFWSITPNDKGVGIASYELVTEVQSPHTHDVTALLCRPAESAEAETRFDFISISLDSTWKLWHNTGAEKATVCYTCIASGSYRDLPCLSAALSFDQSLLAVAHPGCVSVWETGQWEQLSTTGAPPHQPPIPLHGMTRIGWIETSEDPTGVTRHGERLLVVAVGPAIWIWDMKYLKVPKLEWATRLDDPTALLIPSIWGSSMFATVSRGQRSIDVYRVVRSCARDEDHRSGFSCVVTKSISVSHTSPLWFGCGFFGSASSPQLAVLDSHFEVHTVHVNQEKDNLNRRQPVLLTPETEPIPEDHASGKQPISAVADDEMVDLDGRDASMVREAGPITASKREESVRSKTQDFLSAFILNSRPVGIRNVTDPKQLASTVGQSPDGASHLVGAPSTLFYRMVSFYTPKCF